MRCALWYRDWDAPPWIGFRFMRLEACNEALYTAWKLGRWHQYAGICLEENGAPFDKEML